MLSTLLVAYKGRPFELESEVVDQVKYFQALSETKERPISLVDIVDVSPDNFGEFIKLLQGRQYDLPLEKLALLDHHFWNDTSSGELKRRTEELGLAKQFKLLEDVNFKSVAGMVKDNCSNALVSGGMEEFNLVLAGIGPSTGKDIMENAIRKLRESRTQCELAAVKPKKLKPPLLRRLRSDSRLPDIYDLAQQKAAYMLTDLGVYQCGCYLSDFKWNEKTLEYEPIFVHSCQDEKASLATILASFRKFPQNEFKATVPENALGAWRTMTPEEKQPWVERCLEDAGLSYFIESCWTKSSKGWTCKEQGWNLEWSTVSQRWVIVPTS